MSRDALHSRLGTLALAMTDDELATVVAIAERIDRARAKYGPLAVATDARDWRREMLEEHLDALVYGSLVLWAWR